MKNRSDYEIVRIEEDRIFIIDLDLGNLSVTNDADTVFEELTNRILNKLNMESVDNSLSDDDNVTGLPDSTYCRSDNMFPLHISSIEFFKMDFGTKYTKDSHEFYRKILIDYINTNRVKLPDNSDVVSRKLDEL